MRDGRPKDVTIAELRDMGGVGDILGTVIDADGHALPHRINERVIGLQLEDLGVIRNVILAAGGTHKLAVNRAILKRGVVKTFVTDEATARALLDTRG
jgi:DNA-binding transcriptional regulator LsrR (DeoR family)